MPRTPLAQIDANERPGYQLSETIRARIHGASRAGAGVTEIAEDESLPKSTVTNTLQKIRTRNTYANTLKAGRPAIQDDREDRKILRYARNNPKFTYEELKRETSCTLSSTTIRRILHKHGIINWRCKRRPALTQAIAILRLDFALQHLDDDWSLVLFSDEYSVEKGAGKQRQWAFGYPSEKWQRDKIQTYNKGKGFVLWFGQQLAPQSTRASSWL